MPGPTMSHEDSRRRAERASRLRDCGQTWQGIAESEGFRSRGAARTAVKRFLASEPAETSDEVRRSASEVLRTNRAILLGRVASASKRGDDQALVMLSREVRQNLELWGRLNGAHAPTQSEISVRIEQSASAIIARAEGELLELYGERQQEREIIDAEVVA